MRRFITGVFALAMISGAATSPVDLSGTWKMDPARSESAHQDVPVGVVTLIINHGPADVSIETRTGEGDKAAIANETLVFKLDGSENIVTVESGAAIKTKARWDGTKLIADSTRNVKDATVTTHYIYSLAANGAELRVDKTLTVQHGYQFAGANTTGTGKDVFVKQRK